MKKLTALALALALLLSLAACGGVPAGGAPGGTPSDRDLKEPETQHRDLMPEGWTDGVYERSIYDVWDSDVLPDCVPREIPGVKVNETSYKSKDKPSIQDMHAVGDMELADSNYECWRLGFDASEAQVSEFAAAMEANGFYGGITADDEYGGTVYEWVGNGYYAHMRFLGDSSDAQGWAGFSITPIVFPLPKDFFGTKLPTFGITLYDYALGSDSFGMDKDWNETYDYWDPLTGKGELPPHYITWLSYFGAAEAQCSAYARELEAAGWTVSREGKYSDDDAEGESYFCSLRRGEQEYCVLEWYLSDYTLRVGFADMSENFYG